MLDKVREKVEDKEYRYRVLQSVRLPRLGDGVLWVEVL